MGIYFIKLFYDYFDNNDLNHFDFKDHIKVRQSVKSLN